jgi:hypothetical protein
MDVSMKYGGHDEIYGVFGEKEVHWDVELREEVSEFIHFVMKMHLKN